MPKIKVHLHLWNEDFGSPLKTGAEIETRETPVLKENPEGNPVAPKTGNSCPEMVFIDGVMRKEAELTLEHGGKLCRAALFTLGAGALSCRPDQFNDLDASLLDTKIESYLWVENPEMKEEALNLLKEPLQNPELQVFSGIEEAAADRMRELETAVAHNLASKVSPETLILCDGNLRTLIPGLMMAGLIKSSAQVYPDAETYQKNRELVCGKVRSAVFEIQGKNPRYSWYVNLDTENKSPWMGALARLEISSQWGLEKAARIADITCEHLPGFVLPFQARYPQNLGPVLALEKELRLSMGPREMIKNRLREQLL